MSAATSVDKLNAVSPIVAEAYSDFAELPKVTIENFAGFVRVREHQRRVRRSAGHGRAHARRELLARLQSVQRCGGLRFKVLREGMSRAPVFCFSSPARAMTFGERVPALRTQALTPHVIGSNVHLKFDYFCGDAVGQNTCGHHRHPSGLLPLHAARDLGVKDFVIEGELASDKKASWGNVKEPREVQVVAAASEQLPPTSLSGAFE
ncbi:hypothetical protein EJ07DRAFT_160488 [Lizonia empirigonia]|nr:hypothetical protein EJ07DRAFT_160488 [Lizonia empirigonia]